MPQRYADDDVLTALNELECRSNAYSRVKADAGPNPDEAAFLALLELELSMDAWRSRLLEALARRGIALEQVLGRTA